MPKKLTKPEFVERANKAHNNRYDYSKVDLIRGVRTKVTIGCSVHGEFTQMANNHLHGQNCSKCSNETKKITKSEFIDRSNLAHENKYDYSKVDLTNGLGVKVKIWCPKHGEFKQNGNSHLKGAGCNDCGNEKIGISRRVTTAEFIERANVSHSNKYDYSQVNLNRFGGASNKVTIICPEHDEFKQIASSHLGGAGCKKCAIEKTTIFNKITKPEFIKRANEIHDYKFKDGYAKVDLTEGILSKVIIWCPDHEGEFEQIGYNHLVGATCLECRKVTKDDFIKRSNEIHDSKFKEGYAKVDLTKPGGLRSKVKIECPEHGEFEQRASTHLRGYGCLKCRKLTKLEFIKKANKAHDYKYDYSKIDLTKGTRPKVIIGCPDHGEFKQEGDNHLQKHGCPKCATKKISIALRLTKLQFIERANKAHDYKYKDGYTKVDLIDAVHSRIKIECPEHGEFKQLGYAHLQGQGCNKCSRKISKGEKRVMNHLITKDWKFKREKKFNALGLLRLDFIVFDNRGNPVTLIEYQGKPHYTPVNFSGKLSDKEVKEELYERQERDEEKRKFAEERDMPLLIIDFWHFDKIEELIEEFCIEHNIKKEGEVNSSMNLPPPPYHSGFKGLKLDGMTPVIRVKLPSLARKTPEFKSSI